MPIGRHEELLKPTASEHQRGGDPGAADATDSESSENFLLRFLAGKVSRCFVVNMKNAFFLTLALGLTGTLPALARLTPEQVEALPPPATVTVDFARDIKPLFDASCVKCHGRGSAKGGFSLDSRETFLAGGDSGPAAESGRSTESYLIELVSGLDPENVMPVKGSRLTPEQVGLMRAWIDQGLVWPDEVSFVKPPPVNLHPREVPLPPATGVTGDHPVDRLLQPYFQEHGIQPATPVDDRVFARRVYLDTIGLLPPPEELAAFEADTNPAKRGRLVEELLADNPRYAEHWLTFWNDLLRNDYEGTGYIDGGRKQITGWLHTSLAENKPFDRFVAELVDPVKEAEGFVKGIVWRGTINASQTPPMQAAQNISQVFMGVNLKCASCHDSLINDWKLADAYGMAGIYTDEPLEMVRCDKPTGQKAEAGFLYPELGEIPTDAAQSEKRHRLAEILTSQQNGRLTRTIVNRLWAKFMGRGLVEPLDDMEQPAWSPDLLDWLAEDLLAHDYDLKRTMRMILTSRAYQLPAVGMGEQLQGDFVFTGPAVRRMSAEQFRDAFGTLAGVWFDRPAAQFDLTAGRSEGAVREELLPKPANWIWNNAEAAQKAMAETVYFWKRFSLDRVPEQAFVAATCDNSFTLYVNGNKALSGGDYQQPRFADIRSHLQAGENRFAVAAVNHTPDNKPPAADQPAQEADANPAGFLLYARLRQGSQVLDFGTDASWLCSKTKEDGWEQPDFAPTDAVVAAELGDRTAKPWDLGDKLASALSLALIHGEVRSGLVAADPLTTALGRPNREQVNTSRDSAATTLQALELTNGRTLSELLQQGAENLLAEGGTSSNELVSRLYAKALGRRPTPTELEIAGDLLGEAAGKEQVEDLLWAMLMLPEFQMIY
jgi:mono/diheme cytochrome c family protein